MFLKCHSCGSVISDAGGFCSNCGAMRVFNTLVCVKCCQALNAYDEFCRCCGTHVFNGQTGKAVLCCKCGAGIWSFAEYCWRCGSVQTSLSQGSLPNTLENGAYAQIYRPEKSHFEIASIITSIICIILILARWMQSPELSLFGILDWVNEFFSYINAFYTGENRTYAGAVVVLFIILPSIISMIAHCKGVFTIFKETKELPTRAYVAFFSLLIAVIGLIVITLYANKQVSETRGYTDMRSDSVDMSVVPFLALLITAINSFILQRKIVLINNAGRYNETSYNRSVKPGLSAKKMVIGSVITVIAIVAVNGLADVETSPDLTQSDRQVVSDVNSLGVSLASHTRTQLTLHMYGGTFYRMGYKIEKKINGVWYSYNANIRQGKSYESGGWEGWLELNFNYDSLTQGNYRIVFLWSDAYTAQDYGAIEFTIR